MGTSAVCRCQSPSLPACFSDSQHTNPQMDSQLSGGAGEKIPSGFSHGSQPRSMENPGMLALYFHTLLLAFIPSSRSHWLIPGSSSESQSCSESQTACVSMVHWKDADTIFPSSEYFLLSSVRLQAIPCSPISHLIISWENLEWRVSALVPRKCSICHFVLILK